MGAGNANRSGGLDRPSPAQVIADLDKFVGWEADGSPRVAIMREAAALLRRFAPKAGGDPLEDPDYQARSYRLDTDKREKQLRICFFRDHRQKGPLGYLVLETPEIYSLGTDLIKHYDSLEGIK